MKRLEQIRVNNLYSSEPGPEHFRQTGLEFILDFEGDRHHAVALKFDAEAGEVASTLLELAYRLEHDLQLR